MNDLQIEIENVFSGAEKIWDSQQYGNLKNLWDQEDPSPI